MPIYGYWSNTVKMFELVGKFIQVVALWSLTTKSFHIMVKIPRTSKAWKHIGYSCNEVLALVC